MRPVSVKSAVLMLSLLFSGSLFAAEMPVVASFSILGDVAKQIGGERVAVTQLVGPDADAHAYRLTGSDVKKIASAKLILLNGLGLEKADIARSAKQSKVPYIEAAAGIRALENDESAPHHHADGHEHNHGRYDPHVWHDPVLMQKYAANIAKALIQADPAGKDYYQKRFQAYSAQLKELDAYARKQFGSIPADHRKVLTGHHSFSYMGKRYGIRFIAPQGVSTEAEPSAKTVAAIIRQIKQQGLKAVFTENIKDGRMVERIAEETGVKVGGKLYSDALSKNAPAKTYAELFKYNVRVMSQAMQK